MFREEKEEGGNGDSGKRGDHVKRVDGCAFGKTVSRRVGRLFVRLKALGSQPSQNNGDPF